MTDGIGVCIGVDSQMRLHYSSVAFAVWLTKLRVLTEGVASAVGEQVEFAEGYGRRLPSNSAVLTLAPAVFPSVVYGAAYAFALCCDTAYCYGPLSLTHRLNLFNKIRFAQA